MPINRAIDPHDCAGETGCRNGALLSSHSEVARHCLRPTSAHMVKEGGITYVADFSLNTPHLTLQANFHNVQRSGWNTRKKLIRQFNQSINQQTWNTDQSSHQSHLHSVKQAIIAFYSINQSIASPLVRNMRQIKSLLVPINRIKHINQIKPKINFRIAI